MHNSLPVCGIVYKLHVELEQTIDLLFHGRSSHLMNDAANVLCFFLTLHHGLYSIGTDVHVCSVFTCVFVLKILLT